MNEKIRSNKNPWNRINGINTEYLLKRIDRWNHVNLKTESEQELRNDIIIPLEHYILRSKTFSGTNIYRIRKLTYPDQLYNCKADIWYPKEEYVKKIGRVNYINESILYCSLEISTAIEEVGIQRGDCFALIQYSIKENFDLEFVDMVSHDLPEELNSQGRINLLIIDNFINNTFTQQVGEGSEFIYHISNLICKKILKKKNIAGWLYPSVPLFSNGNNLAIKPDYVDNFINFDKLSICKLKGYNIETKQYNYDVCYESTSIVNDRIVYSK